MNTILRKRLLLVTYSLVILMSCKKDSPNTDTTPTITYPPVTQVPHDIYLAGNYYNPNKLGETIAAYWKNGVATLLETDNSTANSIFVSGNDVYVSGTVYSNGSQNTRRHVGKYWKNGVRHDLIPAFIFSPPSYFQHSIVTRSIFVSGNDVYVAGHENGYAILWKNGVPTNLAKSASENSSASSVFVSGNDVYVAGAVSTPLTSSGKATYWKNGSVITLGLMAPPSLNSYATSIFVSGSDVYVAGYEDIKPAGSGYFPAATYWKNGIATKLDSIKSSAASSIYVSDHDVYILSSAGTFWKNSVVRNLNDSPYPNSGYGTSITVSGEEVFIGGTMNDKVTYWRNNIAVSMKEMGWGTSIFVQKK